jgi:hypothetical protein
MMTDAAADKMEDLSTVLSPSSFPHEQVCETREFRVSERYLGATSPILSLQCLQRFLSRSADAFFAVPQTVPVSRFTKVQPAIESPASWDEPV